jgi:hypothetical protein
VVSIAVAVGSGVGVEPVVREDVAEGDGANEGDVATQPAVRMTALMIRDRRTVVLMGFLRACDRETPNVDDCCSTCRRHLPPGKPQISGPG